MTTGLKRVLTFRLGQLFAFLGLKLSAALALGDDCPDVFLQMKSCAAKGDRVILDREATNKPGGRVPRGRIPVASIPRRTP
jgi:hypothetical protein